MTKISCTHTYIPFFPFADPPSKQPVLVSATTLREEGKWREGQTAVSAGLYSHLT